MEHCSRLSSLQNSNSESARDRLRPIEAELLDLANSQVFVILMGYCEVLTFSQLNTIGIQLGFIPEKVPFQITPSSAPLPARTFDAQKTVSNPDIVKAMSDAHSFYELYSSLARRTIKTYNHIGRRRFALKLQDRLASINEYVHFLSY